MRLWKCFDLVQVHGLYYRPGLLPATDVILKGYLYSGANEQAFLVQTRGLKQPKAWRGVVRLMSDNALVSIRYKTLGVFDRQIWYGFLRVHQGHFAFI
ncbi:hypothetical protein LIER_38307 [Lithospermum erythrorhizon]|uniref:Uncharacterized protein n=1 Tax=Lithospermum erythrorhizon TaxID=34254 RepID=A0AAV3Q314_LITER